ncbi:MAG TPA: response regulator transcription factor [Planctomycetota bacterium]|nr:response regulator transcription factor [Planctomycetota bacterium]
MNLRSSNILRTPAALDDGGLCKQHVLVAEDDPDQSDFLRDVLEHEGYAVETVFSGDMALRRLDQKKYALAIMDVRMPGLSGGTVLKVCRVKTPPNPTPVIMVSAFATDKDRAEFLRDGAAAFLSKPYDIDELLNTIRGLAPASTKAP